MLSSDIPGDDPKRRQRRIRRLVAGAFVLLFIVMLSVTTLDSVGAQLGSMPGGTR